MAAVEITISGMLYDKLARTQQNVVLIGEATLTGLGVGGGPIYPPPDGEKPPSGPPPHPAHPIWNVPIDPGYGVPGPPYPELPPEVKPDPPKPGDPTTVIPGDWPTQPITPPPFIVVNYPGIGPVVVAPPASAG